MHQYQQQHHHLRHDKHRRQRQQRQRHLQQEPSFPRQENRFRSRGPYEEQTGDKPESAGAGKLRRSGGNSTRTSTRTRTRTRTRKMIPMAPLLVAVAMQAEVRSYPYRK